MFILHYKIYYISRWDDGVSKMSVGEKVPSPYPRECVAREDDDGSDDGSGEREQRKRPIFSRPEERRDRSAGDGGRGWEVAEEDERDKKGRDGTKKRGGRGRRVREERTVGMVPRRWWGRGRGENWA
jgi:hypothetical protein